MSSAWPEPMESLAMAIFNAHPSLAWLYDHPMVCRGMARAALDYLTPEEREMVRRELERQPCHVQDVLLGLANG